AAPRPEPADAAAAPPPPATPKAADVDANAIEKADTALSLARAYVSAGRYDAARARLQSIIRDYPKTTAAKQAKDLLDQIAGK
ncbi:MAG TPA: tetratricopeptide repeat protein, partial [Tepidisphaeraceae bacterium]|nr:tetratricopeptide repeat protein [Tepidisphaeraceae bacterium]